MSKKEGSVLLSIL